MIAKKLADNNTQMGILIALAPFVIDYFFTPIEMTVCIFIAVVSILVAIITPTLLSPITKVWLLIGTLLGKIFSSVFLFIFYFTLITGLGAIYRFLPEGRRANMPLNKIQSTWHNQKHYDNDLERQS